MSWLLHHYSINPRAEHALSTVGRALHIATRFEEKCRFVLQSINFVLAHERREPNVDFDELLAQLPRTSCWVRP